MSKPSQEQVVFDYTHYPNFNANLAVDGVQFSPEVDTAAINTDVEVFSFTINPHNEASGFRKNEILWAYANLDMQIETLGGGGTITWQWQAREIGAAAWINLHTPVAEATGVAYVDRVRKGYINLQANLQNLPIQVRLIMQCTVINDGRAHVRNTTFVRTLYRVV